MNLKKVDHIRKPRVYQGNTMHHLGGQNMLILNVCITAMKDGYHKYAPYSAVASKVHVRASQKTSFLVLHDLLNLLSPFLYCSLYTRLSNGAI